MSNWTVNKLEIEDVINNNPTQFFGAEESQDSVYGQTIPGNFIMEIWNQDKTECIWILKGNPLPPTHGSGADLRTINGIPNTNLQVFSYYYDSDPNQKQSEQWHQADCPAEGWGGKSIHIFWVNS